MSEIADKPQSVTERLLDISTAGVWPQFASLLRGIKRAPEKWVLLSFPVVATLVIGAIAAGQVRLNAWQGALYDALQRYDLGDFLHQLVVGEEDEGFAVRLFDKVLDPVDQVRLVG